MRPRVAALQLNCLCGCARAVLPQQINNLALLGSRSSGAAGARVVHRQVHWRGASATSCVDMGALAQELAYGSRAASPHGAMQCGYASAIDGVDIRASRNELRDDVDLSRRIPSTAGLRAWIAGVMERCRAATIGRIRVSPVAQHQSGCPGPQTRGREMQWRVVHVEPVD